MPCSPVRPASSGIVKRKIRFVEPTSEDIEEVMVDTEFKDYGYARYITRTDAPRAVVRDPDD
eukprot:2558126-Heterocapsa_arctica.AAC.1